MRTSNSTNFENVTEEKHKWVGVKRQKSKPKKELEDEEAEIQLKRE
jgi:hypothetical protein